MGSRWRSTQKADFHPLQTQPARRGQTAGPPAPLTSSAACHNLDLSALTRLQCQHRRTTCNHNPFSSSPGGTAVDPLKQTLPRKQGASPARKEAHGWFPPGEPSEPAFCLPPVHSGGSWNRIDALEAKSLRRELKRRLHVAALMNGFAAAAACVFGRDSQRRGAPLSPSLTPSLLACR
uniref:Uncharacterized protein n=1 Tax=Myotis myotis TaxID=51298 RepID=A0A7J7RUN9_MYOMY|nr:hypothetical protein mMyoMyo1_010153 [Myotis myotis]